ncbi:hypothetical protein ACLOJK_010926 [Asimina triloba]
MRRVSASALVSYDAWARANPGKRTERGEREAVGALERDWRGLSLLDETFCCLLLHLSCVVFNLRIDDELPFAVSRGTRKWSDYERLVGWDAGTLFVWEIVINKKQNRARCRHR